ncbi:MAG TPA: calcium-binding protein, partial [Nitrospira sp.]|nr:calcium-binding protein [Nitrospira sp.]
VEVSGSGNVLIGSSDANTLTSDGFTNTLIAEGGANSLFSDGFSDVLVDSAGSALLLSEGFSNTLLGGNAADTLSSTGFEDTLVGGDGPNTLLSSGSSNTLIAGSGANTLLSEGSDDLLFGGSGADVVLSSGGRNNLVAGTGRNTLSSSGFDDALSAGTGIDTLLSSGTNTTMTGNAAGSTLDGTAGIGTSAIYSLDNVTVNLATGAASINGSDVSDTLLGIPNASVSGQQDTLIAGSGPEILSATGSNDTLLGNAAGSSLSLSSQSVLAYSLDDVAVNLAEGTAGVNGSGVSDTIFGAAIAAALGHNDTLMAGNGSNVLMSDGGGNTLIAGTGTTVAAYAIDDATINLEKETAAINGMGVGDTLVGITVAGGFGTDDTLLGGAGSTTLLSDATGNTLIAGVGQTTVVYALDDIAVDLAAGTASVNGFGFDDTLRGISQAFVSGDEATLIGGAAGDLLSLSGSEGTLIGGTGTDVLSVSGEYDTVIAGSGASTLSSSGQNNILIAGIAANSLVSAGSNDTIVGNAVGSSLVGSNGTVLAYTLDNVVVDLATGTAGLSGSGVTDAISGISVSEVLGHNDTLIGGSGITTLVGSGNGDTLVAGAGQTVVRYGLDDVGIDLTTGLASITGSIINDTLIDITDVAVSGANDAIAAGAGAVTLSSSGSDNT